MSTFFADALRDIKPSDFVAYLRSHGWREDRNAHPRASLWLLGDPPHVSDSSPDSATDDDDMEFEEEIESGAERYAEILVPRDDTLRDYTRRLAEGFDALQRVERRSWLSIARDVMLVSADVIRLQRESRTDSIPLDDGRSLVQRLLDMIAAAACSAVVPRAVAPTRRPLQAVDYLKRVQLGQTEKGSYVFTAFARVEPLNTPGSRGLEELWGAPFPRQVTDTLVAALGAVTEATDHVHNRGSFEAFPELVNHGISANLCEALAGMVATVESERPVGISVSWATTVPNERTASRTSFTFAPAVAPILRQAAAHLRATEPILETLVTGVVERLARGEGSEEGVVTVTTVIGGSVRKLQVPLPPADYRQAVEAHRDRLQVLFKATIEKHGRAYLAKGVQEFRVIG